ncbi:class I SAM-dependent methyltransferase [Amycolatopsis sp. NPDC003865]
MTQLASYLSSAATGAKQVVRRGEELLQRSLATVGVRQAEETIAADSQEYWKRPRDGHWKANSHWKASDPFAGNDVWARIGAEHLTMFEAGARMVGSARPWNHVVEWGCGGGANAVHFAPRCGEFIGVDISPETLDECRRQVAATCDTSFRAIEIAVDHPEAALREIDVKCDIFLCFYVFELIPTPAYGERLLRIARELLAPGGLALVQIKYDTGRWRTRPRHRSYRSGLAEMTTYPIDSFWQLATKCGLTPHAVQLVPKNELDERYAYFFMTNENSA